MPTRNQGFSVLFVIIITLSGLLIAACGDKRAGRRSVAAGAAVIPVERRKLPPLPERPLSPELEAVRERAMGSASATRGLAWKTGVRMTELSGWEYGTRARAVAEMLGGDDLKTLSQLAIAGGVLPEGTDLATLAVSFAAASADATYSPLDKRVLLHADPANPAALRNSSLLTHEYVHALQDQHFDLLKLLVVRPYDFDRTEAAFALVEGDAMNVQRRMENGAAWSRRSLDDIARQEDERFGGYRKEIGALFPPLLTETFIFRYRDGARFVEAVRRSTSPARSVDELFRRPPASSEQVLHPEKYFAGESPRDVRVDEGAFGAGGWQMTTSTPLGEIGVRGLLLAGISTREATRAAAGWGGDRAYLFDRASAAPLFVWKTAWDTPQDAVEFFRAYNSVRRRNTAQGGDTLVSGDDAQTLWRKDGRATLVRRDGDTVIVIRGAEADIAAALELVKN